MSEREKDLSPEEEQRLKLNLMKAQAVRQATFEIIGEMRDEIVRRSRAKLVAMGVQMEDEDVPQVP